VLSVSHPVAFSPSRFRAHGLFASSAKTSLLASSADRGAGERERERERERESLGDLAYLKCKETFAAAANLFIYRQERERR